MPRITTILIALTLTAATSRADDSFARTLTTFLDNHCAECHDDTTAKADLDLFSLSTDLSDPATFATWERIHDRVAAGEMPPAKKTRPAEPEKNTFLEKLATPLTQAHAAHKGTVLRRLNRLEYQNTLNDIFGTNLDLASLLPDDGRADGFDTVGEALSISMVQMQRYLEAAGHVIDTATANTVKKPRSSLIRASYADTRGADQFIGKNWHKLPDGAVVFYQPWGYPTGMLREADTREPGFYKIRVTGYAHQSEKPITFAIGATTFQRGAGRPTFAYRSLAPGKPTTVEIEAWIEDRYMVELTPHGIADADYDIKNHGIENYKGPGLAILHVELQGPIVRDFPSPGHHLLFDGLGRQEIQPKNPGDKEKSWYKPKFEITATDPTPALLRLATRAFRRPVDPAELTPYLELFNAQLADGADFETSLRTAATAILCAPDFLFLKEQPGVLNDHALAARLAYVLTRTLPDPELAAAAANGDLTRDPNNLLAHADRLLAAPHADRFITDFTDAWLDLRNIEFTNPDKDLFPEFDAFLQFSMLQESRAFFKTLITENLPATNLVRSDFAMLNNRLADHYAIPGVDGPGIRRVKLPDGSPRGGVLSQAGVLKVSANGTNTSPVVRGVWVMERILGETPAPPPPGTPGVEPDIRGASTLREILDKHRDSTTCNSCHQKIDPPGFALESFNPIGGWRDRFRSLGEGEKVTLKIGAQKVRYKLAQPVDPAGQLPDGTPFTDFNEFRDLLAGDPDTITRTLTIKLLTFATGRELGFSDRPEIDRIVAQSAVSNHNLKSLLHHILQSKIFLTK